MRRSLGSVTESGADELFDVRILGRGAFVEEIRQENDAPEPAPMLPLLVLIQRVAGALGVETESLRLRKRNKQLADARSVLCYFAVREMGHNGADVGRLLNISRAGVSAAASRSGHRGTFLLYCFSHSPPL